ncbi:type II toxin-antitoxin system HigB family toxin [Asinibacterium sp. OR53]|uniref:type II toxin-antitoxin system HigB family toxin n=1 Tax=Asinibacterium sp. OR53 TaxID=925409 RepID=UPI000479604F|nr:type II toxin-antitoxin system HigB family toxin [Asinibacterium sp. OR53]
MRVRLIKCKSIEDFAANNARSRSSFKIWLALLQRADWLTPNDICTTYGSADLLGDGTKRVVFDIAGNNYRMICTYHFGISRVHLYVKWIGTHAQYTALFRNNEHYTVNDY